MEFFPRTFDDISRRKPSWSREMMSPVLSGLYLYALISQFVELKDMFSVG